MRTPSGSQEVDTKTVKRRVLSRALTAPVTVAPIVAGMTLMLASWALGARLDLGVLAGLAGAMGSFGVFITKLVLSGERYAREALDEQREAARRAMEQELDDLERRLQTDGDPRTEAALRDLRALAQTMHQLEPADNLLANPVLSAKLRSDVLDLFRQCVQSLERSLSLWITAQKMASDAARQPFLEQRERLLQDVFGSVRDLGAVLVAMQNFSGGEGGAPELARIRQELDQNLAVAREVDGRLRDLERELDATLN